ncbi:MAG: hypothetical protein QXJ74_04240 [Nitrososphaera sp.]|uniref:hypothetical protein n=1 Tax=Nitrososphaera sp. TaxID=1971748 RepID=UPI00316B5F0A
MNLQRLAWKCTQEVITTLGEPTMQSLEWHMSQSGISMVPEEFDIKRFHAALYELMGDGADIIMELVAKQMAEELEISADYDKGLIGIERVLRLFEIAEKVKG